MKYICKSVSFFSEALCVGFVRIIHLRRTFVKFRFSVGVPQTCCSDDLFLIAQIIGLLTVFTFADDVMGFVVLLFIGAIILQLPTAFAEHGALAACALATAALDNRSCPCFM